MITKDNEPWFVARDVCDGLGFANGAFPTRYLDDDEKNTLSIEQGIPGNPRHVCINESGLYSLILRSRKPEAKTFKKWVTSEVLPAIRKDGMYVMGEEQVKTGEKSLEELALMVVNRSDSVGLFDGVRAPSYILISESGISNTGNAYVCSSASRREKLHPKNGCRDEKGVVARADSRELFMGVRAPSCALIFVGWTQTRKATCLENRQVCRRGIGWIST